LSRYFRARIEENRQIHKAHNLLTISPFTPIPQFEPGQFLMIGLERMHDPLLKRPFSILRETPGGYQILYRIKGKGTMMLSEMRKGSVVDGIGPLGKSFPFPERGMVPLVVAGGIGIASLFSLAERCSQNVHIFYGARTRDELFLLDDLRRISGDLILSTEDGSLGERGQVTEVLHKYLSVRNRPVTQYLIYTCGPLPMMERVGGMAMEKGIAAYLSMEENMACGIGACLGCVVKTIRGYQRVCKEGAIFPVEDIVW
jgi:dihydroorotate dehydrogenase electron transfer subunit